MCLNVMKIEKCRFQNLNVPKIYIFLMHSAFNFCLKCDPDVSETFCV